jgi:hypothetical protein
MIRLAREEDLAYLPDIEVAAGRAFADERLCFGRLPADELTPGLRAIRTAEAERGLDRLPRVAMRLERSAEPG